MDPVTLGWKLFVLGQEKTPLPNCEWCRTAGPQHDREVCTCLTCHGIYAATNDVSKIALMEAKYPGHPWAVRCGRPSGIIVIDAEGTVGPQGLTGVEVLDQFDQWTGHDLQFTGLIAETPSGGVHRFYRYVEGVRSRNRVLPQVDIKSDGGYVVIPTAWSTDRRWITTDPAAEPDSWLVDWLRTTRGKSGGGSGGLTGHSEGYDYDRFVREGRVPTGLRDEFLNEAVFRLRKQGYGRADAVMWMREIWKTKILQPPDATWYLPWWNVEYKIERVWQTIAPDPDPSLEQIHWAEEAAREETRVGRVTLAPRGER